ncbi:TPA: PapG chaperone-binding domain-containing protein [Serratia marcescens]
MKRIWTSLLMGLLLFSKIAFAWELAATFVPNPYYNSGYFKVKIISWDTTDQARNPLRDCGTASGPATCELSIGFTGSIWGWGNRDVISRDADIAKVRTMGELGEYLSWKGLLNVEQQVAYSPGVGLYPPRSEWCFFLGYMARWGYIKFPGGAMLCTKSIEITPNFCSISESSVELQHGEISADRVNGHTASRSLHVSCNTDYGFAIVAVDGSSTVNLGGGLQSQLKIDGVDIGSGYKGRAGPAGSTYTITSTLSGRPDKTGHFSGSKVIVLTLP